MKRFHKIILLIALVLPAIACANIYVENGSSQHVSVRVHVPDGDYATRLGPDQSDDWDVIGGGTYTVNVLPDEEYRTALSNMQRYFMELLSKPLTISPPEFALASQAVPELRQELEQMATTGNSCSGEIDDLIQQTISVRIFFDPKTATLFVQCQ